MQRVIDCDVDGVLLDIYTPVEKMLNESGYDIKFERDCTTWSMQSLGELRPLVLTAFTDPNIRVKAEWYSYAESMLMALSKFASQQGFQVILNTHEINPDCANIKYTKCKNIISKLGVRNIGINVQTGGKKVQLENSQICIEDSLPNLIASPAYLKFLIPHRHNSPKTNTMPVDIIRIEPLRLTEIFAEAGGFSSESYRGISDIRYSAG